MKKQVKQLYIGLGCVISEVSTNFNETNRNEPFKILLTKRINDQLEDLNDKWELPGGKIHNEEIISHAVTREIFEETGYRASPIMELDRIFIFYRDYQEFLQHTYISCLLLKLDSPQIINQRNDRKIGDVKWFFPSEIDYTKTLVGSREFITDVVNQYGLKIYPESDKISTYIKFEVLSKENIRFGRKYVMIIQFHPNSEYKYSLLTYRSGFRKKKEQPLLESFHNFEELEKKTKMRMRTRFNHDYCAVYIDTDFPFTTWIKKKKYPIHEPTRENNGDIQLSLPY